MKSIFGLSENIAAAASYIFGPFSGLAVLIMERENKFVRFHALQSTLWFFSLMIIGVVLGFVAGLPLIGWILGWIIRPILSIGSLLAFVSWVFLIFKAYSNESFKIPFIGDIAWRQANK